MVKIFMLWIKYDQNVKRLWKKLWEKILIMILVSDNDWLRCKDLNVLLLLKLFFWCLWVEISNIKLNTPPLRIGVNPYIWMLHPIFASSLSLFLILCCLYMIMLFKSSQDMIFPLDNNFVKKGIWKTWSIPFRVGN